MNLKFRLLLLLITIKQVNAQNNPAPVLSQKITIEAHNEMIRSLLSRIEKQIHMGFSYDAKIIDTKKKKKVSFKQKTIPEILFILFDNKVKYKIKGNYIILYMDPAAGAHYASKKPDHSLKAPVVHLKSSRMRSDSSVLYFIDMIVQDSSGKDSVVRTDSIKVPSTHYPQIQNDTTILLIKKGSLPPPK